VTPRLRALDLLVLAAVAVAGLAAVPLPFSGDQALFSTGAAALSHGAAYYRDFWDIKQPGVYWWHQAAAAVFGPGPVGAHLFLLGWSLALALVLQLGTRDWFRRPWIPSLLPVAVVLPPLVAPDVADLTQIEHLVALPLAVLVIAAWRAAGARSWRWALLAGLAGGVLLVFKLLFVLLVVVVAVGAAWHARRQEARGGRRAAVAAAVGLAVPVLAAVLALLAAGAGAGLLWRTTAVIPLQVGAGAELHRPWMLKAMALHVLPYLSLTAPLALLAVLPSRRPRGAGGRGLPPGLAGTMLGLVAATLAVVAGQRWSNYQPLTLLLPVGVLAGAGGERLVDLLAGPWSRPRAARRIAPVVGALLLVPAAVAAGSAAATLAGHGFGVTAADRAALIAAASPDNARVRAEADVARAWVPPGSSFYALGNPLYYPLLGCGQALGISGWAAEQMTRRQWQEWTRELRDVRPRHVYVDGRSGAFLRERAPAAQAVLDGRYRVTRSGGVRDAGTWYESLDPAWRPPPGAARVSL